MITIILLIFSVVLYSQEVVVTFDAVETRNNVVYLKGTNEPFTGKLVSFFGNNKKASETTYFKGEETGISRIWYPNGVLKCEMELKSGKIHGKWKQYYENGQLEVEANYENDYLNGYCIRYYENGNKKEEGTYEHCKEQGWWIYYNENGEKQQEVLFKNGELVKNMKECNKNEDEVLNKNIE